MKILLVFVFLLFSGCGGFLESFAANALGGVVGHFMYDKAKSEMDTPEGKSQE